MSPSTKEVRKLADRIYHIMPQVEADGWLTMCRLARDLIDVAVVVAMERDALAKTNSGEWAVGTRTDPYPYASAEDRARHRRSIAARWERAQKDAEAITALFKRNDVQRNPAFAKDWAKREASFQAFVPNMDPAVNVPLVDLVRRVGA